MHALFTKDACCTENPINEHAQNVEYFIARNICVESFILVLMGELMFSMNIRVRCEEWVFEDEIKLCKQRMKLRN